MHWWAPFTHLACPSLVCVEFKQPCGKWWDSSRKLGLSCTLDNTGSAMYIFIKAFDTPLSVTGMQDHTEKHVDYKLYS